MANAAILTDGIVIQTSNLENLQFNLDGFLVEFKLRNTDIVYKSVETSELRQEDIDKKATSRPIGYFNKSDFLQYLAGQRYLSTLKKLVPDDYSLLANTNDNVIVERLSIQSPYAYFYNVEKYTFPKQSPAVDSQNNIIIPNTKPVVKPVNNLSAEANLFYNARIKLVDGFDSTQRDQAARLITEAALLISMINREVFSLFNGNQGLSTYILSQNTEWQSGSILVNPSIEGLNNFKNNLLEYYKQTYSNQIKILLADSYEKFYWVALGLSINALSLLSSTDKIKLLVYLAKKLNVYLESSDDENLVVNICLSFNSINITEIDSFLGSLLIPPDAGSTTTLYETVYSKMSTSTNFKEGLLGLANWVLNTDFKPTQTKGQFVQAIYSLWQYSKYNPYYEDGRIKSNTLGFKVLDSSAASFDNEDSPENQNMLFYYSHVVGYKKTLFNTEPSYTGEKLYTYKQSIPDASPIVMPYESEKFVGVYFDNFNFKFSGNSILAYQQLPYLYYYPRKGITVDFENPLPLLTDVLYGKYQIFQPVTLINTNQDTKAPIATTDGNPIAADGHNINSFIPLFVLEYIDSANHRNNVEALIGYFIDGALTFSGIGNLEKLRHLRWAAIGAEEIGLWTIEGLRVVVGGVDFTSGVLSYLLGFINCDENDGFCKSLKSFLNALQMATLSINTIDSLAVLTARLKARRLLTTVSTSSDNAVILSDLSTALGGGTVAEEAASKILLFANLSSQFDEFLSHAKSVRSLFLIKFQQSIQLIGGGKFNEFFYSLDDITTIVTHLSTKVNFAGQLLDKTAADFVFAGSKIGKIISTDQLIKQISFFYDEILKRGFPSGFASLENFESFCQKTRSYLSNNFKFWSNQTLDSIGWDRSLYSEEYINNYWKNFNFTDRVELIVQGSANRKYLEGDPLLYTTAENLPSNNPNDFELGIGMTEKDFNILLIIAAEHYSENESLLKDIAKSSKKGFVDKNGIDKIFGNKFLSNFRDIIKDDTRFPGKNINGSLVKGKDINFAIVRKGGPYDLEPYLPFK